MKKVCDPSRFLTAVIKSGNARVVDDSSWTVEPAYTQRHQGDQHPRHASPGATEGVAPAGGKVALRDLPDSLARSKQRNRTGRG
jgi:hypothetical protein